VILSTRVLPKEEGDSVPSRNKVVRRVIQERKEEGRGDEKQTNHEKKKKKEKSTENRGKRREG